MTGAEWNRIPKGKFAVPDYEKAFAPDFDSAPDVFDARGVDRDQGAIILVRPDQYVAHVLPLGARDELVAFLERSMIPHPTPAHAIGASVPVEAARR